MVVSTPQSQTTADRRWITPTTPATTTTTTTTPRTDGMTDGRQNDGTDEGPTTMDGQTVILILHTCLYQLLLIIYGIAVVIIRSISAITYLFKKLIRDITQHYIATIAIIRRQ